MREEARSAPEERSDEAPSDQDDRYLAPADPEPPEEVRTLLLRDFGEGYVPV
jgi:hypothetical protein